MKNEPAVLPMSPRSDTMDDKIVHDRLVRLTITDFNQTPRQTPSSGSPASLPHRSSSPDQTKLWPSDRSTPGIKPGSIQSYPTSSVGSSPAVDVVDAADLAMLEDVAASVNAGSLQYFHHQIEQPKRRVRKARPGQSAATSAPPSSSASSVQSAPRDRAASFNPADLPRGSSLTIGQPVDAAGGSRAASTYLSPPSPSSSPRNQARESPIGRDNRPASYVDLLNTPYHQQTAPAPHLDNSALKTIVGHNASLLNTKKTLEMYLANVKKTANSAVQYEFAVFLSTAALEMPAEPKGRKESSKVVVDQDKPSRTDLLRMARQVLEGLVDRRYPFAQYYLGDGYASGLFNRGKPNWDRAFGLFVAANKLGHAESGYRVALCYEYGWGCRRDYAKAAQYYRVSASRGHPGAATRLGLAFLSGDLGLVDGRQEGPKWLKRAQEMADMQYNVAPYELGLLYEVGYDDVFKDEQYAAQLFTQAAELGNPNACLKMGKAYEHGLLTCPKDPALSIHFYTCAAQADVPEAMLALCAWYLVGAPPVLAIDEAEAYAWAKRAAGYEYPKAQYTVGYFTEMGIGCRRDPLEANVWYVNAADAGDELAKHRLEVIRAAATGEDPSKAKSKTLRKPSKPKGNLSKTSPAKNSSVNLSVMADERADDSPKVPRKGGLFSRLGR